MKARPSSLPMLAACSHWEGAVDNDDEQQDYDKDAGTLRHAALASALRDKPDLSKLDDPEAEAVSWALGYIQCHAPASDYPMQVERTMVLYDEDFAEVMRGTPDVACGPHIFDLKWRYRDYTAQMAAYALMHMEMNGFASVRVHLLFSLFQKAVTYDLTHEEATAKVRLIMLKAGVAPTPNEYCSWCSKIQTCPAVIRSVEEVAKGYNESDVVKSWHPSAMETAEEIALGLWVWRNVLKKWGESMEYHAMQAATKKGMALPGFKLGATKGKSWCSDVPTAFGIARLPQEEFLRVCDVRMNTSKKYPDRVGLIDIYAKTHGTPKSAAKKQLTKALTDAGALTAGTPSQVLRATTETGTDEEE